MTPLNMHNMCIKQVLNDVPPYHLVKAPRQMNALIILKSPWEFRKKSFCAKPHFNETHLN